MNIVKTTVNTLLLILIMTFTSCKVYKLKQNDFEWQPYKKGDILIFENSNGNTDTINVNISNTRNSKTISPYNIFDEKYQVNSSRGELNNTEPTIVESKQILFKRQLSLIHISRENDNAYIGFSEYNPPANFDIYVPIKEMSAFRYQDNLLGEYFKIVDIDKYSGGFSAKLSSLLFSKKYGYLKFEFKDSSSVNLKEFIRDGKSLFIALDYISHL